MLRDSSTDRRSIRVKKLPVTGLLVGLVLVFLVVLSRQLASGSNLPLLVAIGLLALVVLIPEPIRGVYIAYPLMFLVPYGVLRLGFPFFDSPLDIIVSMAFALGVVRFVARKRELPKSGLYLPLLACAVVLVLYTVIGHGEVADLRLFRFVQGIWPFFLVILLLDTPRQARNIILSVSGTMFLLSLSWLPAVLTGGQFGESFIRSLQQPQATGLSQSYVFIQNVGSFSYLTLLALAFVAALLFSLCIYSGKLHYSYWVGFIVVAAVILGATYAAAVLAFVVGMVMVFLLGLASGAARGRAVMGLGLLLLAILLVALLVYINPQTGKTAERLLNPSLDTSGGERIFAIQQGVHAFLASPIIGNGAFNRRAITSSGYYLEGHNTFIVAAYEFGLLFLVPYLWLFFMVGKGYVQLIRRTRRPLEKAIAVGMAASFGAAVVTGFITPVFGEPSQDAVIWLFIGLVTVWNSWLAKDPEAELVT